MLSVVLTVVVVCIVTSLFALNSWAVDKERVLYSFQGNPDAANPEASLAIDAVGNLYGTTDNDGAYGYGAVFELVPGANGTWTEKVLYSFCTASGCRMGLTPQPA